MPRSIVSPTTDRIYSVKTRRKKKANRDIIMDYFRLHPRERLSPGDLKVWNDLKEMGVSYRDNRQDLIPRAVYTAFQLMAFGLKYPLKRVQWHVDPAKRKRVSEGDGWYYVYVPEDDSWK